MPVLVSRILRIAAILVGLILILSLIVYIFLIPHLPKTPKTVDGRAELEEFLEDLTEAGPDSPPGLSLAVVKGSGIVYAAGFGTADGPRGIAASADTVYNQWSMVKPMTAAAVLQLEERGLLALDDPVARYLPFLDLEYPSPASDPVTVRQLLNHTAGLANTGPEIIGWIHFEGDPEVNQTELLKQKLPDYRRLEREPGSESIYTNVGYMVLAAVIEAVSGTSYQRYMADNLFAPLGMEHTSWTYTEAMRGVEAAGTNPRVDLQALLLPLVLDKEQRTALIRERGEGRLWFNRVYTDQKGPTGPVGPVVDTARFLTAVLNGGELDGRRVLSRAAVEAFLTEGLALPGGDPMENGEYKRYDRFRRGIGWVRVEHGDDVFLSHSGGGPGFATSMRIYPERDLGMVVMANGSYLDRSGILDLAAGLEW